MRISYGDSSEQLKNPLPDSLEEQLTEIYSQSEPEEAYKLDFSALKPAIETQVADITAKWNRKAVNAQLSGRDKEMVNGFILEERTGSR